MVTGEGRLVAPEETVEDLDGLAQPCDASAGIVERDADRVVLGKAVTGAEADLDPSARQRVEREDLASHDGGMAQVVVEHER